MYNAKWRKTQFNAVFCSVFQLWKKCTVHSATNFFMGLPLGNSRGLGSSNRSRGKKWGRPRKRVHSTRWRNGQIITRFCDYRVPHKFRWSHVELSPDKTRLTKQNRPPFSMACKAICVQSISAKVGGNFWRKSFFKFLQHPVIWVHFWKILAKLQKKNRETGNVFHCAIVWKLTTPSCWSKKKIILVKKRD